MVPRTRTALILLCLCYDRDGTCTADSALAATPAAITDALGERRAVWEQNAANAGKSPSQEEDSNTPELMF